MPRSWRHFKSSQLRKHYKCKGNGVRTFWATLDMFHRTSSDSTLIEHIVTGNGAQL